MYNISMSWGTCYQGNNNIYSNLPPFMNDGRVYSSWQPEAVINKRIQSEQNIKTNWDYRKYLQENGSKIMAYNNSSACNSLGIKVNVETGIESSNNTPYIFKSTYDTTSPLFGYHNSDLKSPYLSKEQLNARKIAPSISYPF